MRAAALEVAQGPLRVIDVDLLAPCWNGPCSSAPPTSSTPADPVEAVLALTSGGVDHALEVVGRPLTVEPAFTMLRTGGTATVVGVPRPEDRITIAPMQLLVEKRLQGSQMGSTRFRLDVPLYAQLYLAGRIKLDGLLTRFISLDEAGQALDELDSFNGARSVIRFDA